MLTVDKDGNKVLVLDKNITGCILATFGDTDGDGVNGLRLQTFVDIPFDGTDDVRPLFDSGEMEGLTADLMPEGLTGVMGKVDTVVNDVVSFAKSLFKK